MDGSTKCKPHKMQILLDGKSLCVFSSKRNSGSGRTRNDPFLEKCFHRRYFALPRTFAFIGLLTSLSKNQISNWTRQKRYLLRKKGLLPPVDKSKRHTRRKKRKEFAKRNSPYEPTKFLCPKLENFDD
eukprot:UN17281